jgi:hypothetical protein
VRRHPDIAGTISFDPGAEIDVVIFRPDAPFGPWRIRVGGSSSERASFNEAILYAVTAEARCRVAGVMVNIVVERTDGSMLSINPA